MAKMQQGELRVHQKAHKKDNNQLFLLFRLNQDSSHGKI